MHSLAEPKATGRLRRGGVCLERDGRASSGPSRTVQCLGARVGSGYLSSMLDEALLVLWL